MRKIIIIAIALVILGVIGTAIWRYDIRPAMVRNECNWLAQERLRKFVSGSNISNQDGVAYYEMLYNWCIRNKGLDK